MQEKKKKPSKGTGLLEEIFEPIERGLKRLVRTPLSQIVGQKDTEDQPKPLISETLVRHLRSCSDEQLAAIVREIESILRERKSI